MKLFDWIFGKKKEEKVEYPTLTPIDLREGEDLENAEVKDNGVIKTKCPYCRNKRSRINDKGEIICRRCKMNIGRAV